MKLPEEWLECHFILSDGETFKVGYEYVEIGKSDSINEFRDDLVKTWIISNGNYSRTLTKEEVSSVIVVVKDEYQDKAPELPEGMEPGQLKEEE